MAWKWYDITKYIASVGGELTYYGSVQLVGTGFYALLKFHKEGPLPDASAPTTYGQRFYGHMDYQQLQMAVDLLRNERPMRFGWNERNLNEFKLTSAYEPVGEGDGALAPDTP